MVVQDSPGLVEAPLTLRAVTQTIAPFSPTEVPDDLGAEIGS